MHAHLDDLSWLGFPGELSVNWLGIREGQKRSPLTADQIALLREGDVSVHDVTNAFTEKGLALIALEAKGYLRSVGRRPDGHGYSTTDYRPTPAGKQALADALAAQRRADLAQLGVTEIPPER